MAMFAGAVDAKRAVGATRGHRVVVVKKLLPLGCIEKRLMRYRRPSAEIANFYWTPLIGRCGCETRHVNCDRQIRAWATRHACHLKNAVTASNKNVIKAS